MVLVVKQWMSPNRQGKDLGVVQSMNFMFQHFQSGAVVSVIPGELLVFSLS